MPLYMVMVMCFPLFSLFIRKIFSLKRCFVLECLYVIFTVEEIMFAIRNEEPLLLSLMTKWYMCMIIFLPLFSFFIRKLFNSKICFFLDLLYVIFLANEIISAIFIEEELISVNVFTIEYLVCLVCFWTILTFPSYYNAFAYALARRYKLDPKQLAILLEILHVTFGVLVLQQYTVLFISKCSWLLYWFLCFLPKYLKMQMNKDIDDYDKSNHKEDKDTNKY